MTPTPLLFRDFALIFVAALLGGLIAWKLRLPAILGYVAGGVAVSPLTPGPSVAHLHNFELFAEIGVVLLMFSVGIEFSIHDLLRVKWVALVGGPLGIVLSIGLGLAVAHLFGWGYYQGFVVGAAVSVASTMVVIRQLLDRKELDSLPGLVMVSITLMEDVAVVVLTVLLPILGKSGADRTTAVAWALTKALLLLIPLTWLAVKVIPRALEVAARTGNTELYLLVILAICFATAVLAHAIGLSLALGAFLAGLSISGSSQAHKTLEQMMPLRDAFVALFFVTIGALINPRALFAGSQILAVMLFMIIIGKMVIWTCVVRIFGYPIWTALVVAVGLTQIGEFSFVLVQAAHHLGLVGEQFYSATLAVSLISIFLNVLLIRFLPDRVRQLAAPSVAK